MSKFPVTLICDTENASLENIKLAYVNFCQQSFHLWEWYIPDFAISGLPELSKDERIKKFIGQNFEDYLNKVSEFVLFFELHHPIYPTAIEKLTWLLTAYPELAFVRGLKKNQPEKFKSSQLLFDPDYFPMPYMFRSSHLKEAFVANQIESDSLPANYRHWLLQLTAIGLGKEAWIIQETLEKNIHKRKLISDDYDDEEACEDIIRITEECCPNLRAFCRKEQWKPSHSSYQQAKITIPYHWKAPLTRTHQHLVFLVPHFTMGGSDKFNIDLCKTLVDKYNWKITFISTLSRENSWIDKFREISDEVFSLPELCTLPEYPRIICSIIESRQPIAVFISNSGLAYQLLPYLKNCNPHIPFIDYLHIEEMNWRNGGYPNLSIQNNKFIDYTFTSSNHLRNWMLKRGVKQEKLQTLRINIDAEKWDPSKFNKAEVLKRYKIPKADFYILFVGRICEQKNPPFLANILRELNQERKLNYISLIVGDGPDFDEFSELLDQYNIENVRLFGQLKQEQVKEILAISDIMLLPSNNEGIALAIYEAMAMKTVVIASDVGGQNELLTEECGILIPKNDYIPEKFAKEAIKLCKNKEKLIKMADFSRKRIITHFRHDFMVEKFVSLITQAIKTQQQIKIPTNVLQIMMDEIIEQNRLAQLNFHYEKLKNNAPFIIKKLNEKLDNFRGMIARRDKKIAQLEFQLKDYKLKKSKNKKFIFKNKKAKTQSEQNEESIKNEKLSIFARLTKKGNF